LPADEKDGICEIELPDKQDGLRLSASLFFQHGRLTNLSIRESASHSLPSGDEANRIREQWFKATSALLTKTYGPPECTNKPNSQFCMWQRPGIVQTLLSLGLNELNHKEGVGLVVMDPGPEPPPPATVSDLAKRTDPKTWSAEGWQDLRFKMGIADVLARLKNPSGKIRTTRASDCTIDTADWSGVIHCRLSNDQHELVVIDKKPSLSFTFVDGALLSIALDFHEPDSMESAVANYMRLRDLLVAKYDKPAYDSPPQVPTVATSFGTTEWKRQGSSIVMMGGISQGHSFVSVSYSDPSFNEVLKKHALDDDATDRDNL
jgi:hypothetical protein